MVSSDDIAEGSGVSSVQVRKDLSFLGASGTRGVGYDVGALTDSIAKALGLGRPHAVAIIGAGNLGSALAGYQGFASRGFHIAAIYDVRSSTVGTTIGDHEVRHIDRFGDDVEAFDISIAMIATPAQAAQEVARMVVEAGVSSILNFAPAELGVPDGVTVRRVDLATELQILSYHLAHS